MQEKKELTPQEQAREEAIAKLMEKTGWTRKETRERLKEARERLGVPAVIYNKYDFHTLSEEEQAAKYEEIKEKRSKKKAEAEKAATLENKELTPREQAREEAIVKLMEKTGWTRKQTREQLKEAKERLGVSAVIYNKYDFHTLSEEEQAVKYAEIKEKQSQRKAEKEKKLAAETKTKKNIFPRGEKPETPYGTKISGITRDGIEFYWKKLERASGYLIYRAYREKGPFEQIAEIKRRGIGTYIDSQFDRSRKKVYYTVCSYVIDEDGKYTYSERVEPKAAEFRNEMILERPATYLYSGKTRGIRAFHGWGEVEDAQWKTSDERIATVSPDGVITAVSSGECTLTCMSASLRQQAQGKVVVDRKACEPLSPIKSRFSFNSETGCWENKAAEKTNDAVIMMVGDMMCGKLQMTKQYTAKEGWNFNDSYAYVKDITAKSDFAMGNLETLLAAGWPYMTDETYIDNMNNCNATSRYLDAVRYGGFDAVAMANNHNCDGGRLALLETIDQVDKYQFAATGVFRCAQDPRFFLADINGIKVGYLAYMTESTGFNGKDADWPQEDKDVLLNVFTEEKATRDIAACRAAGAEYVIVYMHWGFKNHRTVSQAQIAEAQAAANAGADYIIGGNPHVLQEYDVVQSMDGRAVPCIYSTGNFQSVMNQVEGNRDSVIIRIRLKKDKQGNVDLWENNYIPCYAYPKCGKSRWAPVAVSDRFNTEVKKEDKVTIRNRIVKRIGSKLQML